MTTANNVGRTIGVLLLLQGILGGVVNFGLLRPVFAAPGFLVNAAPNSLRMSFAVVLGLAAGALSAAIAIAAWPVLRRYSEAMALWLLALAIVGLSLAVVENSAVMSLLSLSQAYAKADVADAALFEPLRGVVAASRNWAHYTHLLVGGGMYLVFYGLLYRFALIPRALAAFGLFAVVLQLGAVGMPLFGYRVAMLMLVPMGLSHLALAVWLGLKGFEDRLRPTNDDRLGAGLARQA